MSMQPYVLASQSPRRRELLAWLDLPFHAIAADVDETPLAGEPPAALATRLAKMKARAAAQTTPTAPVLSADTVVDLEGVSLGKPADPAEAWAMLTALRGREHAVHTGVALWDARTGALRLRRVTTMVAMRAYSDAEIAAYIATGDPFDKAGGYAIQHASFSPVARLDRCYANVVGLPLCTVLALLAEHGEAVPPTALALCRRRFGYPCPSPDWGQALQPG